MNRLLGSLSEICAAHRLEKKYLIVPSYQVGRQIGDALAAAGSSWVNLYYATLPALAQEVAGPDLVNRGVRVISGPPLLFLIDRIFREFKDGGRLTYFGRVEATPGIIRALARSLFALRMAGLRSSSLNRSSFINRRKGEEMILLLRAYEEELERQRLLDLPGIYGLALNIVADRRPKREGAPPAAGETELYLALADRPLSAVEREFLQEIAGDSLILVPQEPVFGLVRPRRLWDVKPEPAPSSEAAAPSFSWLFAPQDAPPTPPGEKQPDIFSAIGPTNECREILRRLFADGVPFDTVEIIHPPGGTYPSIIYTLAAKSGLPVTLAEGVPVAFSAPGKVLSGLVEWLKHGYLVSDLCSLIEAGALALPDKEGGGPALTPFRASRYLKNAMIGWGKERYAERLRGLIREVGVSASCGPAAEEEFGSAENLAETASEIARLVAFIEEILGLFPGESAAGTLDFAALCRGAAAFVGKFSSVRSELDAEARGLLVSRLAEAAAGSAASLEPAAAFERLEGLAAGLSVGASGPEPGRLHVSSWRSGGFSGRPVTFVVGLDQGTFPGAGLQDPILLDEEKVKLSTSLPTSADYLRENLWAMAGMLAGLRGEANLSFSAYDIIEERPSFPSSIILQAARLRARDPSLDYSALGRLIPEARGFLPGESRVLDETDWWLGKLAPGGVLKDGTNAVKANFDLLSRGIFARDRRNRPIVGEFEGKIKIDAREVHPLHNPDIIVSASRLEQLARCPFAYLLKYVLEVSPPEEIDLDRARWLGAADRGSLLHEIFAGFMKALRRTGEKGGVRAAEHAPLMKRIADESIRRYRKEIPPPSEAVFEQERQEILQAAAVFLKTEEEREERGEPLLFEVSFGCGRARGRSSETGEDGSCEERLEEPAVLDFGAGRSLRLAGRIDRIDRVEAGLYRVIDYKTGSYAKFEEVERFGRGRALQPAVYALAAEQILRKLGIDEAPRIAASGFSFPTRKGEGKNVMIRGFDRDKSTSELREILGLLLGVLERGHFVVNPLGDNADCDYCDYGRVCGGTAAKDRAKAKKEANPEVFEIFEKLKGYE